MSNTDDVRAALKSATGALTAAEIGELAGLNGGDTSKLLYAMVQTGEVEKQEGEGKATYIRNPNFTSKRATKAAAPADLPAVKPSRTNARKAKPAKVRKATRPPPAKKARAKVEKAARPKKPRLAAPAEATPIDQACTAHTITLQLSTVRGLIRFAMSSDKPLDAATRAAVIDATQEAA